MPSEPPASPVYLTVANSADVVRARIAASDDPRLKEVMGVIITKLHEAIREIEPTEAEWFEAIKFLTATGHKCTDWRQEFILLSDVLGVSMLVDAINNQKPPGASESTVLGPFHLDNAPRLEMGANTSLDGKGRAMFVHGRIVDTEGAPIGDVDIDVWQANDEGFYDVQQRGIQPEFNLRGKFRTAADGRYWFFGAKPRFYPVPTDGPVGTLLTQLGCHPYRPAHLHYILEAEGFEKLTTHIFDPDDPYIGSDAVFGVKPSLLATFKRIDDAAAADALGIDAPYYDVEHDFVLVRAR